jgi:eukaryotic-like serine/threonine-protein kinase
VARTKLGSNASPLAGTNVAAAGQARLVRYCCNCFAVYRTDFERCPHDGGELLLSPADPLIGETVGETYVIEALIGEGAMGRVYRAHHRVFETQRYAVKVLIGELSASSTMRMRFAREASNASRLDHPNVVNVIDYGKTPRGLHYLVMDLVEGYSLSTVLQRGPMRADHVIRIAHQLCEGLDHAHSRGVIHRDFKSDNILIVPAGSGRREVARIADFGLAMSTTEDVRLTTTGVACTPAYAAPEQLRGRAIDHRVDLYGLGATLFEMLSGGYLPFEGNLEQTVSAKLAHDAPSILTRAPNVPPGLVTIISRLLSYDPDHRPRSARAVIRALETSLTLPRPPIRTIDMRPLAKPRRGSRIQGALLGIASLAIAVVIGNDQEVVRAAVPVAAAVDHSVPPVPPSVAVSASERARVIETPAPAVEPVAEAAKPIAKRADRQSRRRVKRRPPPEPAEIVEPPSESAEIVEPPSNSAEIVEQPSEPKPEASSSKPETVEPPSDPKREARSSQPESVEPSSDPKPEARSPKPEAR